MSQKPMIQVNRGTTVAGWVIAFMVLTMTSWGSDSTMPAQTNNQAAVNKRDKKDDSPEPGTPAWREKLRYRISVGGYFPTFSDLDVSKKAGYDITYGYNLLESGNFELRDALKTQGIVVNSGGNSQTATLGEITLEFLYRDRRFYVGPGIGLANASISGNFPEITGATVMVYTGVVGYDIAARWFVEAQYQTASVVAFSGIVIDVGYRF